MKNVFVTGGSGFVGKRLIARLRDMNAHVVALVRTDKAAAVEALGVSACRGDLQDETALTKSMQGCDTVFHIAGHLSEWDPHALFREVNVAGTRTMLAAAKAARASTFIAAGAAAVVMGRPKPMRDVTEDATLQGPSWAPYIATKAEADEMVRQANTAAFRTIVVRPPLIWGEGMPMLDAMVETAKAGHFALPDGGGQVMSTSHVDNVVACLLLAAEKGRGGQAYHVSDGQAGTLQQVIADLLGTRGVPPVQRSAPFGIAWRMAAVMETVWRLFRLRSKPPITRQTLRLIGQDFTLDISKARNDLGYTPVVTWAEGIARMRG
ncbi:3-beta hydroxysteroid dehydrogenase/isomerase [Bradyrhizobium oligotrophicum S58]|uniref:3-beta hydroxysteroid dehydrogenase/isomerase n=1 Tax=Bradyrhizobium oligotrophicum S58 TaxID=1245469 RepID=M4Z0V0_9BRAD|nr:NAD-dependent epimerase/dehydratase family protein [Bradyrhizobium oligotrophicum]BAM86698.1 3-beta hydroxysteroid dehydrogenase/isomerase [Bradyrhizobium oligotrophicum S58]